MFFFSNKNSREEVRKNVVNIFLCEKPGNGTGNEVSKYDYIVAKLKSGKKVILTRPANKKNGFDFLIRVPGINFAVNKIKKRDYPKHEEILKDLQQKKENSPELYIKLREYIDKIYNCQIEIENINFEELNFNIGFETDMLLHVLKWFFIEQDIRYWNYSGRKMLMQSIP